MLFITRMEFKSPPPALVLKYQTDLSLEEKDKLRAEVLEIWDEFKLEAEKAGLEGAAIIACEKPHGWPVYQFKTYGFVFHRQADGTWLQSKEK